MVLSSFGHTIETLGKQNAIYIREIYLLKHTHNEENIQRYNFCFNCIYNKACIYNKSSFGIIALSAFIIYIEKYILRGIKMVLEINGLSTFKNKKKSLELLIYRYL